MGGVAPTDEAITVNKSPCMKGEHGFIPLQRNLEAFDSLAGPH